MRLLASMLLVAISFTVSVFLVTPKDPAGDFLMLWTGARLLGGDIYDWNKAAELQHASASDVKGYVRIPALAVALWPLSRISLHSAFRIWQVLNLGALLAFLWLWDRRPHSYLIAALFPPLWWSFALGQETCILLFLLGTGFHLIGKKRDFTGGFLLAMCAVKPHLFLFVPVLLLAQRRTRALAGALAGGVLLYVISALAAGWDWPARFLASIEVNRVHYLLFAPGLSYVFAYFRSPAWVIAATEAVAAALIYFTVRGLSWTKAMLVTITAGLIACPWLGIYDVVLLLPVLPALPLEFPFLIGVSMLAVVTRYWAISNVGLVGALVLVLRSRFRSGCNRRPKAATE